MKSTKEKESPALAFIRHTWSHAPNNSWQTFNRALHSTLRTAISFGMKFGVGDFTCMAKDFRLGRWCGENLEWAYSLACGEERGSGNASAVAALEAYLKRDAFLWAEKVKTPSRLHVGSELTWMGERVTVTSFNDTNKSLVACGYEAEPAENGEGSRKYIFNAYRLIESRADLPDGSIAIRLSTPRECERRKPKRLFTITAEELNGVRLEYDARRRKHEKAIKATKTLDELEAARLAATADGQSAYRHFDLEILRDVIDQQRNAIEEGMSTAAHSEWLAKENRKREEKHAESIARWLAGEDVRDYLHSDIRLRRKGDFIEVSNGNKVSLKAARLALAFVSRHRTKGWERNGQTFDLDVFPMQRISSAGVQVGCTLIPWGEVDRVNGLLGKP